ncbi:MAG: hypothetical protein QNL51_12420 [Opitutaceae bacterium]
MTRANHADGERLQKFTVTQDPTQRRPKSRGIAPKSIPSRSSLFTSAAIFAVHFRRSGISE